MPSQPATTIKSIVDKLIDTSNVIHNRLGLREPEKRRVNEAFALLATSEAPSKKNLKTYQEFLQRVRAIIDMDFVVLVAVGLGVSAINGLRDRTRVDLPAAIKSRETEFTLDVVKQIVTTFSATYFTPNPVHREAVSTNISPLPTHITTQDLGVAAHGQSSFTGDVYELNLEDVKEIALSGQIVGQVYLIDTYAESSHSFALVPLSPNMANHFAMRRPRVQDMSIHPGE